MVRTADMVGIPGQAGRTRRSNDSGVSGPALTSGGRRGCQAADGVGRGQPGTLRRDMTGGVIVSMRFMHDPRGWSMQARRELFEAGVDRRGRRSSGTGVLCRRYERLPGLAQ